MPRKKAPQKMLGIAFRLTEPGQLIALEESTKPTGRNVCKVVDLFDGHAVVASTITHHRSLLKRLRDGDIALTGVKHWNLGPVKRDLDLRQLLQRLIDLEPDAPDLAVTEEKAEQIAVSA